MRVPRMHNKSRRPKSIPLTAREALLLKEQLLARKEGTSLVFPNDNGARWHRHRVRDEVWQPAVEARGVRLVAVPHAQAHGYLAHVPSGVSAGMGS